MAQDDQQLRRLAQWNSFWLSVAVLVATWAIFRYVWDDQLALEVEWTEEQGLRFRSGTDGPFVVTHLSKVSKGEHEKATAQLLPPIVIVDSVGATLSKSEFDKSKWQDYLGNPLASPPVGTPIVGLYYKPLVTKLKK
jgi:hypothetical protein